MFYKLFQSVFDLYISYRFNTKLWIYSDSIEETINLGSTVISYVLTLR